jgi:hypothetical protein
VSCAYGIGSPSQMAESREQKVYESDRSGQQSGLRLVRCANGEMSASEMKGEYRFGDSASETGGCNWVPRGTIMIVPRG